MAKPTTIAMKNNSFFESTYISKRKDGSEQAYTQTNEIRAEIEDPVLLLASEAFTIQTGATPTAKPTLLIHPSFLIDEAKDFFDEAVKNGLIEKSGDNYKLSADKVTFTDTDKAGKGCQIDIRVNDQELTIKQNARAFQITHPVKKIIEGEEKIVEEALMKKQPEGTNTFGFTLSTKFIDNALTKSTNNPLALNPSSGSTANYHGLSQGFLVALANTPHESGKPFTHGDMEFLVLPKVHGYVGASSSATVDNTIILVKQGRKTFLFDDGKFKAIKDPRWYFDSNDSSHIDLTINGAGDTKPIRIPMSLDFNTDRTLQTGENLDNFKAIANFVSGSKIGDEPKIKEGARTDTRTGRDSSGIITIDGLEIHSTTDFDGRRNIDASYIKSPTINLESDNVVVDPTDELTKQILELKAELSKTNAKLADQLSQSQKEHEELQQKLQALLTSGGGKIDDKEVLTQLTALKKQIDGINGAKIEDSEDFKKLVAKIAEIDEKLNNPTGSDTEEIERLRKERDAARNELTNARKTEADLRSQLLSQTVSYSNILTKEREQYGIVLGELTKTLGTEADLNKIIAGKDATAAEMAKSYTDQINAERREQLRILTQLKQQEAIAERIKQEKEALAKLSEEERKAKEAEIKRKEEELAKQEADHAKEVDRLIKEQEANNATLSKLEEEKKKLEGDLARAGEMIKNLDESYGVIIETQQAEKARLQAELDAKNEELEAKEAEKRDLSQRYSELIAKQQSGSHLSEEENNFITINYREAFEPLDGEVSTLRNAAEELSGKIDALRASIDSLEGERTSLTEVAPIIKEDEEEELVADVEEPEDVEHTEVKQEDDKKPKKEEVKTEASPIVPVVDPKRAADFAKNLSEGGNAVGKLLGVVSIFLFVGSLFLPGIGLALCTAAAICLGVGAGIAVGTTLYSNAISNVLLGKFSKAAKEVRKRERAAKRFLAREKKLEKLKNKDLSSALLNDPKKRETAINNLKNQKNELLKGKSGVDKTLSNLSLAERRDIRKTLGKKNYKELKALDKKIDKIKKIVKLKQLASFIKKDPANFEKEINNAKLSRSERRLLWGIYNKTAQSNDTNLSARRNASAEKSRKAKIKKFNTKMAKLDGTKALKENNAEIKALEKKQFDAIAQGDLKLINLLIDKKAADAVESKESDLALTSDKKLADDKKAEIKAKVRSDFYEEHAHEIARSLMYGTRINNKQTKKFIQNMSSEERALVYAAIEDIKEAKAAEETIKTIRQNSKTTVDMASGTRTTGKTDKNLEIREVLGDSGVRRKNSEQVSRRTAEFYDHIDETAAAIQNFIDITDTAENQLKAIKECEAKIEAAGDDVEKKKEIYREYGFDPESALEIYKHNVELSDKTFADAAATGRNISEKRKHKDGPELDDKVKTTATKLETGAMGFGR